MITYDNKAPSAAVPLIKRRPKKIHECVSPKTAGIILVALQQFMGDVFVEETRKTIKLMTSPLTQREWNIGLYAQ